MGAASPGSNFISVKWVCPKSVSLFAKILLKVFKRVSNLGPSISCCFSLFSAFDGLMGSSGVFGQGRSITQSGGNISAVAIICPLFNL